MFFLVCRAKKVDPTSRVPLIRMNVASICVRSLLVSTEKWIITARKRSLGQGNIFSSVCKEFCSQWGGGGGLPQCMLGYHTPGTRHPLQQTSPGADTPRTRHHPSGPGTPPRADPPGAPRDQAPPQEQTPLEQTPPKADTPPEQCMLGDTVNKRAVCILLECNLVTMWFQKLLVKSSILLLLSAE